ncbi:DNA primase [Alkaliphilus sp. MSJ-5]|uniref:DNA primase n=1 Tax=Alkaliphilus flagellatus TaxID=2841507 RepID=A0ABS6FZP3_9FIRM|nr:DNA primase [Alkaliphilus flagellatus]MBU5675717.1 DNA primase [Alkaliphilus flagellatus]
MENFFPEELINEVKDSNEIIDVISQYIQVKSVGSSYKALCPFHSENTPSFIINREKQIYKCFGCGEGGDVVRFIMKIENLDFIESVRLLAKRANIEIKSTESSEEVKRQIKEKNLCYEINRKVGLYFYRNLTKKPNPALEYLVNRGLNPKTLASFGLGYAINSWDNLILYLQREGYQLSDIQKCGLIRPNKQNGYYDYFRNRIMFPIFNIRGDVVGFGGRVMDNSLPKYLNSPETKIFNKSNILYGLNFARKNINNRQMILVEGYMDVIALHQAGFKNVVASLGTSLTKYHGQLLKKYCDEVIICFDGDTAGIKATMRSVDILNEVECQFRIMTLPEGKDPDDFIKFYGYEAFKEQINNAISLIDYKILLAKNKYSSNTIEDKVKLAKRIAVIIRDIKSPIEKEAYIEKAANETSISKEAIKLEVLGKSKNISMNRNNVKYSSNYKRDNKYIEIIPLVEQKGHIIAEKQLIKFMLTDNKLIQHILNSISVEDFSVWSHQEIVAYLADNVESIDEKQIEETLPHLKEDIKQILSTDIKYIELNNTLAKYVINLKKYKLLYDIKRLEEEQNSIMKDSNLTKEEVESKLLNIGMEIVRKNVQIQKLKA